MEWRKSWWGSRRLLEGVGLGVPGGAGLGGREPLKPPGVSRGLQLPGPPRPQNRFAFRAARVQREQPVFYSPSGDFKSIVKMHGGKIKIYLGRQRALIPASYTGPLSYLFPCVFIEVFSGFID